MKKITLLSFSVLILFVVSCEKEVNNLLSENKTEIIYHDDTEWEILPSTRAGIDIPISTEPVFDFVGQLWDIPVNIMIHGKHGDYYKRYYLSANSKGSSVGLNTKDDGKGLERFCFKYNLGNSAYGIDMPMGSNSYPNAHLAVSSKDLPIIQDKVTTGFGWPMNTTHFEVKLAPNGYYYIYHFPMQNTGKKLQPKSHNKTDLHFSTAYNSYESDTWDLIPVVDFKIEGVRYIKREGDYIIKANKRVQTYTRNNLNIDTPTNINIDVNTKEKTVASISKNTGFSDNSKITNSTSVKIDGPSISSNNTFSTEYSLGSTYSYINTKTQESEIEFKTNQSVTVPANKFARVYVYLSVYKVKLTMITKLKYGSKYIYVESKFEGEIGNDIEISPTFYDYVPSGL